MPRAAGRITFDPDRCGGRLSIRQRRFRGADVPGWPADGRPLDELRQARPDLEHADIAAVVRFAPRRVDLGVVAA